jgi:hypothetical protein
MNQLKEFIDFLKNDPYNLKDVTYYSKNMKNLKMYSKVKITKDFVELIEIYQVLNVVAYLSVLKNLDESSFANLYIEVIEYILLCDKTFYQFNQNKNILYENNKELKNVEIFAQNLKKQIYFNKKIK